MIVDEGEALDRYHRLHRSCDIQTHPWHAVFGAGFWAGVHQVLARKEQECMMLADLIAAIRSNEFQCPGGHRLDGVKGEWEDLLDDLLIEAGLPEDTGFETLPDVETREKIINQVDTLWVEIGKCQEMVEITLEHEGEYGEISYPVAEGPCVAALGMELDEDFSHPLWQRWIERRHLYKLYQKPGLGDL